MLWSINLIDVAGQKAGGDQMSGAHKGPRRLSFSIMSALLMLGAVMLRIH